MNRETAMKLKSMMNRDEIKIRKVEGSYYLSYDYRGEGDHLIWIDDEGYYCEAEGPQETPTWIEGENGTMCAAPYEPEPLIRFPYSD